MPPTAATPAGRTKRPASSRSGHRPPTARTAAPPRPRRVSGPARPGRAEELRAAEARAAETAPRRQTAPARPARRVSGPARPARTRRQAQPAVAQPLSARSVAFLRSLPDHSLLDRIVRGRIWIPLLGILLVGIVAMQVEVLKLNAGIGRSTVQMAAFQTENQHLRTSVAQLSSEQTIETEAAKMGMKMAEPTGVRFVANGNAQTAARAAAAIHAPDAYAFSEALQQRALTAEQAAADAGATQADSTDG